MMINLKKVNICLQKSPWLATMLPLRVLAILPKVPVTSINGAIAITGIVAQPCAVPATILKMLWSGTTASPWILVVILRSHCLLR